jgi:hypothetical protein
MDANGKLVPSPMFGPPSMTADAPIGSPHRAAVRSNGGVGPIVVPGPISADGDDGRRRSRSCRDQPQQEVAPATT